MPENLLMEIRRLQNSEISKLINSRYLEFKSFASRPEEEWFSELCFCLLTANSSAQMGIKVQEALGFDGFYNLPQKKLSEKLRSLGYRFYNKRAEYIAEARKHFGIKKKLHDVGIIASGVTGEEGKTATSNIATAGSGLGAVAPALESAGKTSAGKIVVWPQEPDAGRIGIGQFVIGQIGADRAKRNYLFENVKGLGMKESSHFLRNTGHDNVAILDRHILRTMHEQGIIPEAPNHLSPSKYLEYELALDPIAAEAGLNHSLLDLYLWY